MATEIYEGPARYMGEETVGGLPAFLVQKFYGASWLGEVQSGDVVLFTPNTGVAAEGLVYTVADPYLNIRGDLSTWRAFAADTQGRVLVTREADPLTASGILSTPAANLRTLLSQSATWQTLCDAADATAALANIKMFVAREGYSRPLGFITDDPAEFVNRKIAEWQFLPAASLGVIFELDVPIGYSGDDDAENAEIWIRNQIGAVLAEVREAARTTGLLRINQIALIQAPQRSKYEQDAGDGDYWTAAVKVAWGGN